MNSDPVVTDNGPETGANQRQADRSPPRKRRSLRQRLRRLAIIGAILAVVAIGIFHRPLFLGNVGVVDPGRVYRCSQPKDNLDELIATYQPRSILNLRGGSYGDDWYLAEVLATEALDIAFYDVPMEATRRPSRQELLTLLDLLEQGPFPMLIHCKSGSDRTGLASALYRLTRLNQPPEQALDAFTIWHGHVPIGGPQHLHEPFVEYQAWLEANGQPHSADRFRHWVEHEYRDQARQTADESGLIDASEPLEPGPRYGPPPPRVLESEIANDARDLIDDRGLMLNAESLMTDD